MANSETPKELLGKALVLVEKAKKGGKVKIGVNEVTKAVERGTAKLVLVAKDVKPEEVTMHLPVICKEKGIAIGYAPTKKELGEKAGIAVGTSAIAITEEGENKKELEEIVKKLNEEK